MMSAAPVFTFVYDVFDADAGLLRPFLPKVDKKALGEVIFILVLIRNVRPIPDDTHCFRLRRLSGLAREQESDQAEKRQQARSLDLVA
jgi:hypothetical protein